MSRIQNWQDLHPIEQERTVRLLVKKRNLVRLQKLDAENHAEGEGDALTALKEAQGERKE
jgi:regulator of protease activity HflC (stomatin/prohibitin superfamily)